MMKSDAMHIRLIFCSYRFFSITSSKLSNVLTAGRCVSTDRQMQASIRVMPGCYITGQAVGAAATLCTESEDIRKVNIDELKSQIINTGGIIINR